MRICLLTDAYEGSISPLAAHDLPCDPRPWLPDWTWTVAPLTKARAVPRVLELAREGFDLFFNLCDGAWDEDRPGIEVVEALERLGVPYTGASPDFYEPSREAMKRVCGAWGLDTPPYVMVREAGDVERALNELAFPLIVKHPSSYSSIGLNPASRVESAEALRARVREMRGAWGGALVEAFVEGREYTVLVAEDPDDPRRPVTYTPVGFTFPPGETFKHFDLKWIDHGGVRADPVEDAALAERLREASARFFRGLGGLGYGRADMRVDGEGRVQLLEMNPNPGVFYPPSDPGGADLCLRHDPEGHRGFARRVVAAALRRAERRRRPWEVRPTGSGGYGLFATRTLDPGDPVVAFEEHPHVLVTRGHAERTWGEPQRGWFGAYAWPLTDEVYVMWSHDPMEWRPVNHACEPTAWLDGLDVVARLPLAAGDEVTLDYATFCNETMEDFACGCGAAACRGVIRGSDHLSEAVARYGRHVSDYVRRKRAGSR